MKKTSPAVYSSDQMSKISLVSTPIVHNDDDDDWWWRWPPEWLSHQSECPRQDWCSSTPSAALADFSIEILRFLESRFKTKIFQKLQLTATSKNVSIYFKTNQLLLVSFTYERSSGSFALLTLFRSPVVTSVHKRVVFDLEQNVSVMIMVLKSFCLWCFDLLIGVAKKIVLDLKSWLLSRDWVLGGVVIW